VWTLGLFVLLAALVAMVSSGGAPAAPTGLVAAYAFDEGSGSNITDASGNGNNGTVANVTWVTTGKYGNAIQFNGTSTLVTIPDTAALHLTTAMTLEAWVNPSTVSSAWRDVIYKGNDNYYLEATSTNASKPDGGLIAGGSYADAFGTAALAANTWSFLTETYDGTTLRLYVNGTQVASTAHTGSITTSTNPLQIGGDSIYGQFFKGMIDNVRIYNTALTAAQIATDQTTAITTGPDTTPPTQPGTLTASAVSSSEIDLAWGASTDNVGVTGYSIERCSGSGCSNFAPVTTVTGTTYKDTALSSGTSYSYRVRATDAAGNFSPYTNTATQSTPAVDTQAPTQPGTLSASAVSASEVDLSWGASTDNVGVTGYLIERCSSASCTNFAQIAATTGTGTTYKDMSVNASTTYSYRVRATDAAGNLSPYSNTATVPTPAAPSGLVAAYGFDEGQGTTVTDASGNGNNGTVANGTWVTTGKYGKALQFNGTSTLVTIPDAAALHLSTAMSLEAWVNPSTVSSAWRDVIYKGNDNYYLEATSTNASKPDGGLIAGGTYGDAYGSAALPANTWSFLAETYDGATLRLYVNGTQVAATAHAGTITTSTNPLQIGGDSLYGQFFKGMIDEVRVYNTALTPAQIQGDQGTPVNAALSAPGTLTLNAISPTEVDLSWGAATGGATSYLVERCTGASCNTFTQIGTSPTTTYKDTTVTANNTYSYRVRATDTAGDLGPYSNIATTTTSFSVSPNNSVLTFTRTQQYTAQGPGSGNVTWLVDGVAGGNASTGMITTGGVYTPPSTIGTHTISASTGITTASVTVYISNYSGTFTFHNDNMRDGENLNETVLTPSNVNSTTFGKLFSYPLDGLTFASPLYVQNVNIPGQGFHNIVIVATEHDSVYAFDADGRSSTPLWKDSFINPAAGVNPIPPADTGETGDIPNEIGITGTPVIDPSTNTIYLVAATKEVSGGTTKYVNRLHALDLATGAEKSGSPIVIDAHVPGNGVDAVNGTISFNNITENQRPGLLLANGELYIGFSNHGNNPPYHGWVMAYNPSTLHQDWVFCTTPNADKGGIWMGGDGIAADSSGNLYFSTGNGTFDGPSSSGGSNDFGDSLLKLNSSGARADFFTPYNYSALDNGDIDLASGGIILLPDQSGTHPHEVIAGGKGGTVYVVDRDMMGGVGNGNDNQIVQSLIRVFPTGGGDDTGNYSSPVYYNGTVYFAPVDGQVMAFSLTNGKLSTSPTSKSSETYNGTTSTFDARGGEVAISANGSSNGILWGLQSNGDSTPGTLHAYNPSNLAQEYYTSDQAGTRDQLDPWLKFTIPTVANGRVYVVSAGQLTAYGLLP
jgi:fibronectin type 3 domain-containing protein